MSTELRKKVDKNGNTMVHLLVYNRNLEQLKNLHNNKLLIQDILDNQNNDGNTPLHMAVIGANNVEKFGDYNSSTVDFLISIGANQHIPNNNGDIVSKINERNEGAVRQDIMISPTSDNFSPVYEIPRGNNLTVDDSDVLFRRAIITDANDSRNETNGKRVINIDIHNLITPTSIVKTDSNIPKSNADAIEKMNVGDLFNAISSNKNMNTIAVAESGKIESNNDKDEIARPTGSTLQKINALHERYYGSSHALVGGKLSGIRNIYTLSDELSENGKNDLFPSIYKNRIERIHKLNEFGDLSSSSSDNNDDDTSEFGLSRIRDNAGTPLHENAVKIIMELMEVDEHTAKLYKAMVYSHLNALNEDKKLSNVEKAQELDKFVKNKTALKDFLMTNKSKLAELEKVIEKNREERRKLYEKLEKKEKEIVEKPSVLSESASEKPKKASKIKEEKPKKEAKPKKETKSKSKKSKESGKKQNYLMPSDIIVSDS